jgi:hypothetical protein
LPRVLGKAGSLCFERAGDEKHKAHNSTRWSRPRNMDTVVQALLDKKGGHSLVSPDPEASTLTGTWIEKHKRLLRRRSSETDVIFVKEHLLCLTNLGLTNRTPGKLFLLCMV